MPLTRTRQAPPAALPDALVIGPRKTGTTWIHEYLRARGDVALPKRVKEVWFFDRYYARGLEWYARQFAPSAGARRTIEVTPGYFASEEAPSRVARDLGRIPVLCTLRHPVDRTFSHYLHMLRYGMTRLELRAAVREHTELLEDSRYAHHLLRWRERMGEENVGILFFEDLAADPERWACGISRHFALEARPVPAALRGRVNESTFAPRPRLARLGWKSALALRSWGFHAVVEGAKRAGLKRLFFGDPARLQGPQLETADRAWLLDRLTSEVEDLERMLDQDLSAWKH